MAKNEARNDGGPAFPRAMSQFDGGTHMIGDPEFAQEGMTLRDYFAGQALAGMCSELSSLTNAKQADVLRVVTGSAYEMADAMLAERDKGAT